MGAEEHAQGRAIVLFSDGEDHAARWSTRLERLRQEDVVVHGVAIGDPDQGHAVPSGKNAEPLKYHGEPVLSRRRDATLEQIAHETGGTLVRLGLASSDLGSLYQTKIEPAARRHRETSGNKTRAERFPLCLARRARSSPGGILPASPRLDLAVELDLAVSMGVEPPDPETRAGIDRLRRMRGDDRSRRPATRTPALTSRPRRVARGQAAYNERRWEDALTAFETAISLVPRSAIPRYDAAAALFQLGRFEKAQELYLEARPLADPYLRTKIDFVLGNTCLALGDIAGAIAAYDQCLASTATRGGHGFGSTRCRDQPAIRTRAVAVAYGSRRAERRTTSPGLRSRTARERRNRRAGGGDEQSPDEQAENGPDAGGGGSGRGSAENPDQQRPPRDRRRMGGAGGAAILAFRASRRLARGSARCRT